MSDIRITSDKAMQPATTPMPVRATPSGCFKQQLQRALAARDMPESNNAPTSNQMPRSNKATKSNMTRESTTAAEMTMTSDSAMTPGSHDMPSPMPSPSPSPMPAPAPANNTATVPTNAEVQAMLTKMMESVAKNPFATDFMGQGPFPLPGFDGLGSGLDINQILAGITGGNGNLSSQFSGWSDEGLQAGDLSRKLTELANTAIPDTMAPYGIQSGLNTPVNQSEEITTDQIAHYLGDAGMDDGIFSVLMPNGQHFAVAVSAHQNTVRYLLSPGSEAMRDRLKNCRMELQRTMERRIQRNVEIAVL